MKIICLLFQHMVLERVLDLVFLSEHRSEDIIKISFRGSGGVIGLTDTG